ncbi:hypothetical protein E8E13_009815 [Curvularia kusanoi]|uniref:C2H2-type domain-containing protein n=1 Tax=Curvularia kusanoi TaxID=90978 RepID=A0A9P4TI21_CURKU|nr:hypothetical protein E8E13_009815 [Curvularia kusanoi]
MAVIDSAKKSGSVQQNYICTAPGCKKSFKTVQARAQHLDSAAHRKAVTATGPHKREDAKAIVVIASAHNTQLDYVCTAPGCKRVFKTSQARAQHLGSAVHKKTAIKAASREHNESKSIVVPSVINSSRPTERQPVPNVEAASSKEELPVKHDTTGIPKAQTKTPKAQKPPQPHPANPKGSKQSPLFPWDTRWTNIPPSSHTEIITALHSLLSPPRTQLPSHSHTQPNLKRRAIVLDCEMVGVGPKGTISALARLSAIDFLTGELLIDILVQPFKPVIDWRTTWSGITPALFTAAKAKGQVLEGTAAARRELLQYMDARTVLVGHALHYDLKALGIGHTVTIDSAKLARAAVGNSVKKDWGLKVLCRELLGVTVQDHGKNGHDSVEDALAARELVLWCLSHPEELGRWGARKKEEVEAKKREDAEKERKKMQKQSGIIIAGTREVPYLNDSDDDWEYQNMSLREFNEMCGYPSDYDNWSD